MDRRIEIVLARIANDWQERHRIEDLAASVNLGKSRLEHLFKETVRLSIRELVRQRRITEAAHLLSSTHLRVSEVCYRVGFSDPSNFTHAFRKAFGVSPREYRRGIRKENPDGGIEST